MIRRWSFINYFNLKKNYNHFKNISKSTIFKKIVNFKKISCKITRFKRFKFIKIKFKFNFFFLFFCFKYWFFDFFLNINIYKKEFFINIFKFNILSYTEIRQIQSNSSSVSKNNLILLNNIILRHKPFYSSINFFFLNSLKYIIEYYKIIINLFNFIIFFVNVK